MGQSQERSNLLGLAIATVILGVIVGAMAGLLQHWIGAVEKLFLGFEENRWTPVATATPWDRRFISVLVGAIIAGIVWYVMQRHFKPVKVSGAVNGTTMPFWKTLLDVFTQVFYVGTGGSIGKEMAPREAGALLAQHWSFWVHQYPALAIDGDDRRLLIAAAAGAGFAGVYISPITGAMFCLELLYRKVTARSVAVAFTMSGIATFIGGLMKGFGPYYTITTKAFSLKLLPLAVLLGPVTGLLGAGFSRGVKWMSARRATDRRALWQLPLVGALTGAVAIFFPQVMGNGRGVAQFAMSARHSTGLVITLLVALACLKALATLLTIRGGAYGGILTPSIAIGSCVGVLLGMAYGLLVPGLSLPQCALVGAVGFLTASQQAPLMATFMLFEVCHLNSSALLPLCLVAGISIAVSHWLLGHHHGNK